jgi:bifunctional non-homologous end joining protein LigD
MARLPTAITTAPRAALPRAVEPMLATLAPVPPLGPEWLYELKYDGIRGIAIKDGTRVRILSRPGNSIEGHFPEICEAIARLRPARLVIDGELCVLGEGGVPCFEAVRERLFSSLAKIATAHLARTTPATFQVFDVLHVNGHDLRGLALEARKSVLRSVLPKRAARLRYVDDVRGDGLRFFKLVSDQGLEGIVAKLVASPYVQARTRTWLKVRTEAGVAVLRDRLGG